MLRSTPARIALGGGLTGLALAVLNQSSGPAAGGVLDPALERAGVLASILSVLLMLIGILWERIEPVPPVRVDLEGEEGLELAEGLDPSLNSELAWGSRMLLTATPAATLLVQWQGRTLLRRGLLAAQTFEAGPICRRAMEQGRPISLVDLRLYPGRAEFDALLPGLPAVLVQPLGSDGVLLLGGWSPRCFGRGDLAWVEGWAQRLTVGLAAVSGEVAPASPPAGVDPPGCD
ncbi:MAG: cofactor assembly of complex C subunit B [Cyanobium sp.]